MKKINAKRKYDRARNMMAILINAAIFLVDFPNDLCDWVLKIVEWFACFNILMPSRKWRTLVMLQVHFYKSFYPVKFSNLKNK